MARGFNVNEFRSTVGDKEFLRTNKFLMEFTLPRGLVGLPDYNEHRETVRNLEFWCEVSAIPGINLITNEGRRYGYGPMEKRPAVTGFTDLSVTFFSDAEGSNWRFFNRWLRLINASSIQNVGTWNAYPVNTVNNRQVYMSSYEISYRQEYVTEARLIVYDNTGFESKRIYFREIFPIGISDTQVSWADNNSLMRITVNLSFLDWFEEFEDDLPAT